MQIFDLLFKIENLLTSFIKIIKIIKILVVCIFPILEFLEIQRTKSS